MNIQFPNFTIQVQKDLNFVLPGSTPGDNFSYQVQGVPTEFPPPENKEEILNNNLQTNRADIVAQWKHLLNNAISNNDKIPHCAKTRQKLEQRLSTVFDTPYTKLHKLNIPTMQETRTRKSGSEDELDLNLKRIILFPFRGAVNTLRWCGYEQIY